MDSPLRILFVADRPDDRNDVIRGLEKDFPGVEVTKIREGASFAESIQRFLSISSSPTINFNGPTALPFVAA